MFFKSLFFLLVFFASGLVECDAYQYYPDNYDYFRAQAGYNHNTLTGFDGWIITTADMNI